MNLSSHEKRALFRFMSVYIGAVFVVVTGFGMLFYKIKADALKDKIFNDLRAASFKIASSAIDAQMQNKKFTIPKNVDYMLLDKNKKYLKGTFKAKVDLTKDFTIKGKYAYFISKGAKGHLGIKYIVVREKSFDKYRGILVKTVTVSLAAFIFLLAIGWYLGRLFLEPMKEKIKEFDRFIKDSTHELNTPITSMLLAVNKIEQKGAKPLYLKNLKMSSRIISKVYQDMSFITFNDKIKSEISSVEVSKIIDESLNFFQILIEQKGLQIDKYLEKCHIKADLNHIELLIKNLIENSIKYSNSNSKINIELKNCKFSISNEGETISKDQIKDIFKRYKRGSSANKGFGIGLNIVYTICKKYGYKIDVSSSDNLTTFYVEFF